MDRFISLIFCAWIPNCLREYKVLNRIRKFVIGAKPQDSLLFNLLQSISHILPQSLYQRGSKIDELLAFFAKYYNDVYIMQIGANDGVTGDPLHKFIVENNWSGVLVEPINYVFGRLVKNYQGVDGLAFANVAISHRDEFREMWFLKESEDNLPVTYDQLGSFRYDVVHKHQRDISNIDKYLVKAQVQCITFQHLIELYSIQNIDLLHMDAEGYDYNLLMMFDFDRFMPIVTMYEHIHMTISELVRSRRYLKDKGYKLFVDKTDSIAIRSDFAQILKSHNII